VQAGGFLAGGCFHGEDDVALGFPAVADGHGGEACEGALAGFELPEHRLDAVGGGEFLEVGHLAGERIRDDAAAGEGEEFVEDGHHADDGGEGQRDHEKAALESGNPRRWRVASVAEKLAR
jgi:hypothetical protein